MMERNILICVPHLDRPGGVAEVYRTLDLEKHTRARHFFVHDGVEEEPTKWAKLRRMLRKYKDFVREMDGVELVMVNPSLMPRSFFRDAGFAWLAKWRGKSLLVFWHGWEEAYEARIRSSGWLRYLFRCSFGRADAFITLGSRFRQKILQFTDRPQAHFFQFFNIADDRFVADYDPLDRVGHKEKFRILFLSRIEKGKGIYLAIDTFQLLQKALPRQEFEFVIAGDGTELEQVKNYVAENRITGISFPGFVSGRQKQETYTQADLFFFPSHGEGMPIVVLEAMLYGLPIVTRPVGGLPDLIKNGRNGYLIDSLEPEAFVEPILNLIQKEALYRNISRYNHEYALEHFTPEPARRQLVGFFQAV